MFTYFSQNDILINHATITSVAEIDRSDAYQEPHVIVRFVGDSFVEFPPGLTVHQFYTELERSTRNA